MLFLPSSYASAGFVFNSITGPAESFEFTGTTTIPNAIFLSGTPNGGSPVVWTINTTWAIVPISGDTQDCKLTAFAPGPPLNVQPWTWSVGLVNFATSGTFTYSAPNIGDYAVSAEYIIGFSSTAIDAAGNKLVFDGNVDVTVSGYVPEPSSIALLGTGAGLGFLGLGVRRRREVG